MNRKHWLIFGVIQAIGIGGTFCAIFLQFPSMVLVPLLFLLPGSLASVALPLHGEVGVNWSPWTLCAVAVVSNVIVFTITSFLSTRYRRSKRVSPEAL